MSERTSSPQPADLPIRAYADRIVDAVKSNLCTVVIGETGSGKTTQIAQAAVTVARRVAEEMQCEVGGAVGYAVRFEERTSRDTRILYLTDGTLMKELLEDAKLRRYGVVVLDEAHERSLSTDILFGVLKQLLHTRAGTLRLVVTSATLDGEAFSEYFGKCPVLTVPGRAFPVEVRHATMPHTHDYLRAAVDATLDIHVARPLGDVLLFLPGQADIEKAVRMLNEAVAAMPEGAAGEMLVLPMYAALPPELQARVFAPMAPGVRRVVVATNIAETSITVDGVVYVVDSGVTKQKAYNPRTGIDALSVVPISRVQATQRAGRAGRTRPGVCFRLYTADFYAREMAPAAVPEIQRTSLASAVLWLKSLPLAVDVMRFDFLDRPEDAALEDALRTLWLLDALGPDGAITPLGRRMASLPLEPSLARALLAAGAGGCLGQMLTVAAMLSADTVFAGNRGPEQLAGGEPDTRQLGSGNGSERRGGGPTEEGRMALRALLEEGLGDHVLFLRLYEGWEAAGFSVQFCREVGLDVRGMRFARDVRRQLAAVPGLGSDDAREKIGDGAAGREWRSKRARTNNHDTRALRRALLSGYVSRLAHRLPRHNGYRTLGPRAALARLHPAAARLAPDEDGLLPEWLVFHELVATAHVHLSKVCPVEGAWVAELLPRLHNVDLRRLSAGHAPSQPQALDDTALQDSEPAPAELSVLERKNDAAAVEAARQRYLARKAARTRPAAAR